MSLIMVLVVGLEVINELINKRRIVLSNKRFTIYWLDTPEPRLVCSYVLVYNEFV